MKNLNFNQTVCIFLFLISIILFSNIWKFYPIYGSYLFQDWTYIYDFTICSNFPDRIDKSINGLCPVILEYNFVYPEIWMKFSEIENRTIFKYLILIFIFFYLIFCLNILKKYNFYIKFFFIISPASILLIQRGNNDLIIFFLIYIFYFIIENYKNIYFALLPYVVGILLKIYPVALIPIFFFKKMKIIKNKIFLSSLILITLLSLYFSNFLFLKENYNTAGITLAYNSAVLFKILNYVTNIEIPIQIVSLLILIFIFLISLHNKINLPKIDKKYEISFLIGSATIVSCFFLNEGFVYKLVFLVFTIPLILEYKNKIKKEFFFYLLGILFISLWIEYLTFIIEIIFDTSISKMKINNLNFSNYIYAISILFKNMIYWLLNINLIYISTSLLFRKN